MSGYDCISVFNFRRNTVSDEADVMLSFGRKPNRKDGRRSESWKYSLSWRARAHKSTRSKQSPQEA